MTAEQISCAREVWRTAVDDVGDDVLPPVMKRAAHKEFEFIVGGAMDMDIEVVVFAAISLFRDGLPHVRPAGKVHPATALALTAGLDASGVIVACRDGLDEDVWVEETAGDRFAEQIRERVRGVVKRPAGDAPLESVYLPELGCIWVTPGPSS